MRTAGSASRAGDVRGTPSVPVLAVHDLAVFYDDVQALWHVSLEVREGEILAIIGPNGAGKTTILNTVAGLVRRKGGTVRLDGALLDGLPAHEIRRRGVVLVPEEHQVFPQMSVIDNLRMGAYTSWSRRGWEQRMEESFVLFPRLRERCRQLAGSLSGGEQRMLALARALIGRPRVLLLDEPSLGLAPRLVDSLFEVLARLRRWELTCLIVEQNAVEALHLADRACVLEAGRIVHEGAAAGLLTDPEVARLYLGVARGAVAPPAPGFEDRRGFEDESRRRPRGQPP